jgi:hypothetical protein
LLPLGLQSSRHSRAGLATWAYTGVTVSDDDLPRWRAAHPEATLFPSPADQPRRFVGNSLMINVEPDLDEIECSGLRPRPLGLGEFAAAFGQRVLPVLRRFRSPDLAAPGLPVSWLGMIGCETVEWALARDDPGAAALLIRRHMQHPLRGQQTWRGRIEPFRRGWEMAPDRTGLAQSALPFSTEALGWLARVHSLADPREFREPAHEEAAPA